MIKTEQPPLMQNKNIYVILMMRDIARAMSIALIWF